VEDASIVEITNTFSFFMAIFPGEKW